MALRLDLILACYHAVKPGATEMAQSPKQLNLFEFASTTKAVNIGISKPLTLQEKHELALAKVAKFTRLAALPELGLGEAALALTMKRSAIAELKLSLRSDCQPRDAARLAGQDTVTSEITRRSRQSIAE